MPADLRDMPPKKPASARVRGWPAAFFARIASKRLPVLTVDSAPAVAGPVLGGASAGRPGNSVAVSVAVRSGFAACDESIKLVLIEPFAFFLGGFDDRMG